MHYVVQAHSSYLQKILKSSQLFPFSTISALPTAIFVISSFVFLYQYFHRTTSSYTSFNIRLKRDFKFHWIFFNVTRLWFILLSCMKRMMATADLIIDANVPDDDARDFNKILTYALFAAIAFSLALIPALLVYMNCMAHTEMPNFLMWVMEDPYARHEIGIAGHCLERPLRIEKGYNHKLKNYPYRSRRSTSFDENPWLIEDTQKPFCRTCKSLIEHNVVKSVENLLD